MKIVFDGDQGRFTIGAQGSAAIYTGGMHGGWAALRRIGIRSYSWMYWLYAVSPMTAPAFDNSGALFYFLAIINFVMRRDMEIFSRIRLSFIVSFFILAVIFLVPSGRDQPGWAFIQVARATTWHQPFDWPAVWCSLKILAFCVALFLALDAFGTLLARLKWKSLANLFFCSVVLPGVGFLIGGYYLIKALL